MPQRQQPLAADVLSKSRGAAGAIGQVPPFDRLQALQTGCRNGIYAVGSRHRPWIGCGHQRAP
jgi:hypothetical protein